MIGPGGRSGNQLLVGYLAAHRGDSQALDSLTSNWHTDWRQVNCASCTASWFLEPLAGQIQIGLGGRALGTESFSERQGKERLPPASWSPKFKNWGRNLHAIDRGLALELVGFVLFTHPPI